MLENPIATLNVLSISCAKIRYKQIYLGNHSELITVTYEISSLTTTNTIISHNIELPLESSLVWFGLFVHPFSHICNIGHVNYRLKFTTQLIIHAYPHNTI